MPVSTVNTLNKPRKKWHDSPLYHLQEWHEIMRVFNHTNVLKPFESIRLTLTPETIAALPLKNPIASMSTTLRRYAKERNLPYDIEVIAELDENGQKQNVIYVSAHTGSVT